MPKTLKIVYAHQSSLPPKAAFDSIVILDS